MDKQPKTKRRDLEQSKARILEAAKTLFTSKGYAQTGLREIARLADVSPALTIKHFGSKAGLFEAALMSALRIEEITGTEKRGFGKRLVQTTFDASHTVTLPAMISLSVGDAEAAAIAGKFAQEHMIEPIAAWLGPPRARMRAYLMVSICTGTAIYNRGLKIENAPSKRSDAAKWMEQTIQALVDGEETGA